MMKPPYQKAKNTKGIFCDSDALLGKNIVATNAEGARICPRCRESKEETSWGKCKTQSYCMKCHREYETEKRREKGISPVPVPKIFDWGKECLKCNDIKPWKDFYKNSKGKHGVTTYCKVCIKTRFIDPASVRRASAKHRKKHRSRVLARQRLYQYKRMMQQEATDDGTLTDEVLILIYDTECCYYCGEDIKPDKRTLEHKTPLSRGGIHGFENVVMACSTCNSKKNKKTEKEFREHLEMIT